MPVEWNKPLEICLDITLGYQYFIDREHPLANSQGKVYLHRHVASLKIGRWLTSSEHVHHRDGDRANNHEDNLEVTSSSEHARAHQEARGFMRKPCASCATPTKNARYCSVACAQLQRKSSRPSEEDLRAALASTSWVAVGRRYGVSDNAVRKWARQYGMLE